MENKIKVYEKQLETILQKNNSFNINFYFILIHILIFIKLNYINIKFYFLK